MAGVAAPKSATQVDVTRIDDDALRARMSCGRRSLRPHDRPTAASVVLVTAVGSIASRLTRWAGSDDRSRRTARASQ